MNRLVVKIAFVLVLLNTSLMTVQAQSCPSPGASAIEVCNDLGANGTIRVYFYDGAVPVSYILYDLASLQP
ncbi:MAG TPA: hypothetical protein VIQ51_04980, partial [Chryseosolibacter sp.]